MSGVQRISRAEWFASPSLRPFTLFWPVGFQLEYAPYVLTGIAPFSDQRGALLRVDRLGYGVCHPWPTFGHLPLKQQLAEYRRGRCTPIMQRALEFAFIDRQARLKGISLLEGVKIPPSHSLIPLKKGYVTYKIKVRLGDTRSLLCVFEKLQPGQRVRLDCMGTFEKKEYYDLIELLSKWRDRIEFVEDPFPYSETDWASAESDLNVPLASDWEGKGKFQKIVIYKPTLERKIPKGKKIVVTTLLDHPLGQAQAAWVAAHSTYSSTCGLTSHEVYQTNRYSERLAVTQATLQFPEGGSGFGFDDLLEKESWRPL